MTIKILRFVLSLIPLLLLSGLTTPDGEWNFTPLTSSETDAVVVNFTGDCIFSNHFETFIGDDIESVFADVPWFVRSDINVVNLEHPITKYENAQEKEFTFKMHPRYLPLLQKGNINVVNAANNHIYDYGVTGIDDTMYYLDSINVAYVGIGKTLQEAREPVIFTIKGKQLGFLGYFGGAGQFAATDTSSGLSPRFHLLIMSDIRMLRPKVDYVIVSFHWGVENEHYPEEWQMKLGRACIDAGADLVVGHHPHVLQGIEWHNSGIIAYSLGNFIFGGHHRPVHDTIVLQVLFGEDMIVHPLPVRINRWRVTELNGHRAGAVIDSLHAYSHDFDNCFFNEHCINGEEE